MCLALVPALLFAAPSAGYGEKQLDQITAFLFSFAVPGLGQYYLGATGYAKLFISAELAIWGGYYYNNKMKDARNQDYLSYAALHAGVNPTGLGTSYLNAIGAYNSSFDHNVYKQQRSSNPVQYDGIKSWGWDSEENRLNYKLLRERELDYENNLKYCIAGSILNHFIAGLQASKLAGKQDAGSKVSMVSVRVLDRGLGAAYTRSF